MGEGEGEEEREKREISKETRNFKKRSLKFTSNLLN